MKPVDVTFDDEEIVYNNILEVANVKNRPKIDIGDNVRVRIKERGLLRDINQSSAKRFTRILTNKVDTISLTG